MKLQSVEIFNFKSIKELSLDINSNQICLVGANECGKSSVIEAISYLNIEKVLKPNLLRKGSSTKEERWHYPCIVGVFNATDDKALIEKIQNLVVDFPGLTHELLFIVKRWGNGFDHLSINVKINDTYTKETLESMLTDKNQKAEFFDFFFGDHYPLIEFFENEDLLLDSATVDELLEAKPNYETLRRLLHVGDCDDIKELDPEDALSFSKRVTTVEKKINNILKHHYKQDESITIKIVTSPQGKLNVIILDKTEESFTIDERSPGFRYYFSFLINKLYYNKYYGQKSIIYLLDEPGNNLHPKGAKDLLKSFSEIGEASNIIYTTHNPFLAIRNNIDGLVLVQKSRENGTSIIRKAWKNKHQVLRRELGILLNDSFLISDLNLIVEGITEKYTFDRIFQQEKYSDLEWINIYDAESVSNIPQALKYLGKNNLDLAGLVLLDSDGQAKKVKTSKDFINSLKHSHKWDYVEINNVFNNDYKLRSFEDLFPQDILIEAFNKYCQSLKDTSAFVKEFKDFNPEGVLETPIIDKLQEHFKEFANEGSTIVKQNLMGFLLDIVEQKSQDEQLKILVKLYSLADIIQTKIKIIKDYVYNQA